MQSHSTSLSLVDASTIINSDRKHGSLTCPLMNEVKHGLHTHAHAHTRTDRDTDTETT